MVVESDSAAHSIHASPVPAPGLSSKCRRRFTCGRTGATASGKRRKSRSIAEPSLSLIFRRPLQANLSQCWPISTMARWSASASFAKRSNWQIHFAPMPLRSWAISRIEEVRRRNSSHHAWKLCQNLRLAVGLFAVPGNHDMQFGGIVYHEVIKTTPLTDLTNRSICLTASGEHLLGCRSGRFGVWRARRCCGIERYSRKRCRGAAKPQPGLRRGTARRSALGLS